MSCTCNDLDAPTLISEGWRRARNTHKCCECGRPVQPGEFYQHIAGIWDGRWMRFKTCEQCADLRESLESVWCVALGDLRQEYIDYLAEADSLRFDDDGRIVYPINHMTAEVGNGQQQMAE